MAFVPVLDGLYRIELGGVSAYLITGEEPVLIDAGYQRSAPAILAGLVELGISPQSVKHILLTHSHADHAGGLVAVQAATGAKVINHAEDAAMLGGARPKRPMRPAPGLRNRILFNLFIKSNLGIPVPYYRVRQHVSDGETLPIAGGITAWHTPGHCSGHLVFQWRDALILGDAAFNIVGLGEALCYEDLQAGRASLRKLAALDFDTAVFGHGAPIVGGAGAKFKRAFAGKWID